MREYQPLWLRVVDDFRENSKTVVEEINPSKAKTMAKAIRKEKLKDEANWKISYYYELFADYDEDKFELTLELRPRRGRNLDGVYLRSVL